MIAGGGGAIVNTSSNQSLAGDLSQFAYSAAKAGVNALTRSIATTYGRSGIRCNTVSPGYIETDNTRSSVSSEMGEEIVSHNLVPRPGYAEDLAHAVLYLVSDDASFVTGQLLSVDGGQLEDITAGVNWYPKTPKMSLLQFCWSASGPNVRNRAS